MQLSLFTVSLLQTLRFLPWFTSHQYDHILQPPSGFPESLNGLWFTSPGSNWAKDFLPVGNGYLAAMVAGGTSFEALQLNIESLWTGGPFEDPTYNGGNKLPVERISLANDMNTIRENIFRSPGGTIGDVNSLCTPAGAYGSFTSAGILMTSLDISNATPVETYVRWLDLDQAVACTRWSHNGSSFLRETFCSHPTRSCVQHISAENKILPDIIYAFAAPIPVPLPQSTSPLHKSSQHPLPLHLTPPTISNFNVTCHSPNTLLLESHANATGAGMPYSILARAHVYPPTASLTCNLIINPGQMFNATLRVEGARETWIEWTAKTAFDLNAGDLAHNFTFRRAETDAQGGLTPSLPSLTASSYSAILADHIADLRVVLSPFSLSLGKLPALEELPPTDQALREYQVEGGQGKVGRWIEWILFNYGRYLLATSARGELPSNLQGRWADGILNIWSADYHANINTQMNYWAAEMTGMNLMEPVWNYIEKNWAPRGAETALTLYNISRGWVTHNEMNIFGHTGMKLLGNSAQWADYPESAVWMMIHVWDHFDYVNDVQWWRAQGWPLMKGVASFHLDKLIPDLHFNDGTLVTCPCNSPEQIPVTFGCAHSQQLIWQLFNAIEKGFQAAGDTDWAFLEEVQSKRTLMDKGIRIGSWGQLQEWKLDMDNPADIHRHLSHLIGLYPGYAIASYDPSIQPVPDLSNPTRNLPYTHADVINAALISLIHRGNGTGPDGDTGWEKVWRAALWAQLGNATAFHWELSYMISRNFGSNLFSLYDPEYFNPVFQIDANLGYPAAVLNALIQAPDVPSLSDPLIITLLPALPVKWSSGSIQGARVRGGIQLDMLWRSGKLISIVIVVNPGVRQRQVEVVYDGKVISKFTTSTSFTRRLLL